MTILKLSNKERKSLLEALQTNPQKYNININSQGFVSLSELSSKLGIHEESLDYYVQFRAGYQFDIVHTYRGNIPKDKYSQTFVRATYGHNFEPGLSLEKVEIVPDILYYSIDSRFANRIIVHGCSPVDTQFIYLHKYNNYIYKKIMPRGANIRTMSLFTKQALKNGVEFFRFSDNIFCTKFIPPALIKA